MEYKENEYVTYDNLMKMKFKVGKIVACTEVDHSHRLLCFQVEVGDKMRQILSGIKEYYKTDEVIGKKVLILDNLKTMKMAGLKSEGILMLAEDLNGKLSLMIPDRDVEPGVEVV